MSDSAPDSAPVSTTTSDSERITALETKLTALIELLKGAFVSVEDGDSGVVRQVFVLTDKKTEMDAL
tara:strand:- start:394 stop:594 length:201 start_codon:yes stop_codon:yes gene_type:complete